MNIIKDFINQHKRWTCLIVYLAAILVAWHQRDTIYCHIPMLFLETVFGDTFLDMIFLSLALVGFTCLFQVLRFPFFQKKQFQKAFERIGLHNSLKEYPFLISVRKDTRKAHGLIFEIKNRGISPIDFDKKIHQLETALNIKIYEITFGKRTLTTLLYAIPRKHDKPRVISWKDDFAKNWINGLVIGKTGSGKSHSLYSIAGSLAQISDMSLYICDFKNQSFPALRNEANYHGYEDVDEGVCRFYGIMQDRLANPLSENYSPVAMIIDEYSSWIDSHDKRSAEEFKGIIGKILQMSRSLNMRLFLGNQFAYMENYATGARSQLLNILAMGNLADTDKRMMFPSDYQKMTDNNPTGFAYLSCDGKDIERVQITRIDDFNELNACIRQAMNR